MSDDLLNSMLGDILEGDEGSEKKASAAAEGLEDLLGGLTGSQQSQGGAGQAAGGMGAMLESLLGGGEQGGELGNLLGTLLGGQQGGGSDLGDMLGGLLGGSGAQSEDVSQLPVIGPIIERLSQELGIPTDTALSIVNGVIKMLGSGKASGGQDLGLEDLANLAEDPSTIQKISQGIAGEVGLDDSIVSKAVQSILKLLFQGGM